MAKDYLEPNRTVISRSSSIAHQLFRFASRIVSLLVLGLVLSITVELLMVIFVRPEIGAAHSRLLVEKESYYLDGISTMNPFVSDGDEWVYVSLASLNHWMFTGFMTVYLESIVMYVEIIINMINVFVLRVCVMLFSFPVYGFCAVVGISRGLVNRELRKWGGGRESSGQFHLWMNLVPLGFAGSWIIYLSWPGSLNPNYIVMPFAVFFGWMLMLTCYRMKKYI